MGLFCADSGFDHDGFDWWWYEPLSESPLSTKRSRKCCSCGEKIRVGYQSRKIPRYRPPTEFEERRGLAGDEVAIADWYLCEKCGDLADSLSELGFCYTLSDGKSLQYQIAEYRKEEAAYQKRMNETRRNHEPTR